MMIGLSSDFAMFQGTEIQETWRFLSLNNADRKYMRLEKYNYKISSCEYVWVGCNC